MEQHAAASWFCPAKPQSSTWSNVHSCKKFISVGNTFAENGSTDGSLVFESACPSKTVMTLLRTQNEASYYCYEDREILLNLWDGDSEPWRQQSQKIHFLNLNYFHSLLTVIQVKRKKQILLQLEILILLCANLKNINFSKQCSAEKLCCFVELMGFSFMKSKLFIRSLESTFFHICSISVCFLNNWETANSV